MNGARINGSVPLVLRSGGGAPLVTSRDLLNARNKLRANRVRAPYYVTLPEGRFQFTDAAGKLKLARELRRLVRANELLLRQSPTEGRVAIN